MKLNETLLTLGSAALVTGAAAAAPLTATIAVGTAGLLFAGRAFGMAVRSSPTSQNPYCDLPQNRRGMAYCTDITNPQKRRDFTFSRSINGSVTNYASCAALACQSGREIVDTISNKTHPKYWQQRDTRCAIARHPINWVANADTYLTNVAGYQGLKDTFITGARYRYNRHDYYAHEENLIAHYPTLDLIAAAQYDMDPQECQRAENDPAFVRKLQCQVGVRKDCPTPTPSPSPSATASKTPAQCGHAVTSTLTSTVTKTITATVATVSSGNPPANTPALTTVVSSANTPALTTTASANHSPSPSATRQTWQDWAPFTTSALPEATTSHLPENKQPDLTGFWSSTTNPKGLSVTEYLAKETPTLGTTLTPKAPEIPTEGNNTPTLIGSVLGAFIAGVATGAGAVGILWNAKRSRVVAVAPPIPLAPR